jgi:hypothetical protein
MYKDKEKQRAAVREAVKRFRSGEVQNKVLSSAESAIDDLEKRLAEVTAKNGTLLDTIRELQLRIEAFEKAQKEGKVLVTPKKQDPTKLLYDICEKCGVMNYKCVCK